MRFELSQTVAAPQARVHAAVSDVDGLLARLSGSRVTVVPTPGMPETWDVALELQGMERHGALRVAERQPGQGYALSGEIDGLALSGRVHVRPLPEDAGAEALESALDVTLALAARSLRGKVVLASLRLMHDHLRSRLEARLAAIAREIEAQV